MRGFLLDTNVVSELCRPAPEPSVGDFVSSQFEERLFVSQVTFAEIRFGIERLSDPERRRELTVWLDRTLRPFFGARCLAVSEDIVFRWRLMIEDGRRRGHIFGQLDLFLGATAAEHALAVVSRDTTHFIAAGLPTLNPWTGAWTDAKGATTILSVVNDPDLIERL